MQNETLTILTILGMALVTYATRAGGFWLMGLSPLHPVSKHGSSKYLVRC